MNKIITYTIMLLLTVGCATQKAYEGMDKGSHELSLIKSASGSIIIRKVDKYYLDKLRANGFETLPGKHTVFVSLSLGPNFGYKLTPPVKMIFDTEAGKKYVVGFNGKVDSKGGFIAGFSAENYVSKGEYFVIEESSGNIIYKIKN